MPTPASTASTGPAPQVAATFPPQRTLMAPGPSNVHPRVLQALLAPLVGHRDPTFLSSMDDIAAMLRALFQTENRATFALPGTGGSGMDAALINLLEPGDTAVIARAGFFADRMVGIAERTGARAVVLDTPWDQPTDPDALIRAVRENGARVLAVVHGETSTGVEHPLDGLGVACREMDAFLVVDAVASLGGTPLPVDDLQIDICYSGSQKCLSAPPGTAPITLSPRALEAIQRRKTPVPSWYLDLTQHARFWDTERIYHHTSPVLSLYALREALRLVMEEGLEQRFVRHRLHASALRAGLEALGIRLFAPPDYQLAPVTTVLIPEGISDVAVRNALLEEFNLEISGGLGAYAGRMWRIGTMGYSATRTNVTLLLAALEQVLVRLGHRGGSGLQAADAVYQRAG